MAKRFLRYETESVNEVSPIDEYGVLRGDIKLSDFKNDLWYEYEETTDLAGYEQTISGFSYPLDIYELNMKELPLALGQKWKFYHDSSGSSGNPVKDSYGESEVKITENGELYIGSPDAINGDWPIAVFDNKIKINYMFARNWAVSTIKLVCVEGSITETKVKQIDKKYIPNMLTIEVDSPIVTDVTIGDKVKEAIQSGQSVCIYYQHEYMNPVCANTTTMVDSTTNEETYQLVMYCYATARAIRQFNFNISSVD